MRYIGCARCFAGLLTMLFICPLWAQIDESLFEQFRKNTAAEALLLFREQADLTEISPTASKREKGRQVYDRLQETARRVQSRISSELVSRGVDFHPFYVVNAIRIPRLDADLAEWLIAQPEVAAIAADPLIKLPELKAQADDLLSIERRGDPEIGWGVESMETPEVWSLGYTGSGVVVGGQDTGYEWDHPVLRRQYRGTLTGGANHNYNWHDAIHEDIHPDDQLNPCGYSLSEPCADNPHGILTMAVAVGELPDFATGLAPAAQWIGCRNMDRGYGKPSTYLECFEWFLAPTDTGGMNPNPDLAPHVINNSWVCPLSEGCTPANFQMLDVAIRHLVTAGVMVVVSAGNDGPLCETINAPPSIFEQSFTVGASNSDREVAGFSSRGTVQSDGSGRMKPDLLAPGVGIPTCGYTEDIIFASGTSLSAPHISGLVALIISARPALSGQVERLHEILRESALPVTTVQNCQGSPGSAVPNAVAGYGHARARRAIELALATDIDGWSDEHLFSLLPNPVRDQLIIRSTLSGKAMIRLYSLQGQLLVEDIWVSAPATLHRMMVNGLPSGMYVCEIQVNGQREAHKIVKW